MTWQDIIAITIVVAAAILFGINIARSLRHGGKCPSCRHGKDGEDANIGEEGGCCTKDASNCHKYTDACAGCPLHASCRKG